MKKGLLNDDGVPVLHSSFDGRRPERYTLRGPSSGLSATFSPPAAGRRATRGESARSARARKGRAQRAEAEGRARSERGPRELNEEFRMKNEERTLERRPNPGFSFFICNSSFFIRRERPERYALPAPHPACRPPSPRRRPGRRATRPPLRSRDLRTESDGQGAIIPAPRP